MDEATKRVRVNTSRARDHIENISFWAGDDLVVGHRNQQYPEFVWCATEDGHAGWAPEALLEATAPGSAVARCDYDAAHLTVSKGEVLEALEQVGDWVRCRNDAGREGWVRIDALEEVPED